MKETQHFNLCDFMPDTLCLSGNINSVARPIFHHEGDVIPLLYEDPVKEIKKVKFNTINGITGNSVETPIQEFFRGVNVFITGGSGFVGKVLTEKLIRSMPHIGHIYLLIRPKRGMNCEQRFDKLFEDKIFSRMKAEVPQYRTKIKLLPGDISEPGLRLSSQDRHLVSDTIHVVFHCAADVRFMEPLRNSIASNVSGSKHVLDVAKEMRKLKAYVHVSTAFSQCVHRVIEETVPTMNVNYKEMLHYVETNTDDHIEKNITRLLQGWPNAYTFSKALCEEMIENEAKELPICIIRPSIVVNTYKEPVKGWTDNIYGPLGFSVGTCLGVVHSAYIDVSNTLDGVPVDYVVNCMIASAWNTATNRNHGVVPVYNFTSSPQNTNIWNILKKTKTYSDGFPSSQSIWYPSIIVTDSYYLYKLCHLIFHRIPGAVLDTIAAIIGKSPRLTKMYKKIEALEDQLAYFSHSCWEFRNDNVTYLLSCLSEEDKKIFNFDVRDICWRQLGQLAWLGLRLYYLKEDMESIPASRKRNKWLYVAHTSLKLVCGYAILKVAVYIAHLLPF